MLRSSERVAHAIRRTILEGTFRAGDRLPPERTLAERFRVTRNTVREALRQLEQLRLVSIRHGSGVTVRDYLANAGVEFLSALLTAEASGRDLLDDVLEARVVIGKAVCFHAIDTFDLEQADAFARAVEAFAAEAGSESPSPSALQALEFDVHACLLRGGGNRALVFMHNSIRHVYEPVAHLFEHLMDDPQALTAEYRRAAAALAAGDRETVKRAFDTVFTAGGRRSAKERSGRGRPAGKRRGS